MDPKNPLFAGILDGFRKSAERKITLPAPGANLGAVMKRINQKTAPTPFSRSELPKTGSLLEKLAARKKKMPHFTEQNRPEGVKKVYRALKKGGKPAEMRGRYGKEWKGVAARIASRQGPPGKQKQGPPYKAPLTGKE